MVLLGAFASLCPEELAELRRCSVDLDECSLRVTQASPELTNGRRVTGDPKTRAGKRTVYMPDFMLPELRRPLPPLDLRSEVAQGEDQGRYAGQLPLLRPPAHRQHPRRRHRRQAVRPHGPRRPVFGAGATDPSAFDGDASAAVGGPSPCVVVEFRFKAQVADKAGTKLGSALSVITAVLGDGLEFELVT